MQVIAVQRTRFCSKLATCIRLVKFTGICRFDIQNLDIFMLWAVGPAPHVGSQPGCSLSVLSIWVAEYNARQRLIDAVCRTQPRPARALEL